MLVNRARKTAARVSDADSLQEALNSIGSAQNIHLARLTKGRRILFLEGDDYRLLRRFASQFGFDSEKQIYVGFVALVANLVVAVVVTVIARQMKVFNGTDDTNPEDYHADEHDKDLRPIGVH